jgi:ATP-binding cassette subfamily B protein
MSNLQSLISNLDVENKPMNTPPLWRLLQRLLRFRLGLYLADTALIAGFYLTLLAPGLVLQRLFDELTSAAPMQFGVWALLAALAGLTLSGIASLVIARAVNVTFQVSISALLFKNLLQLLLRRPGAVALPESPGAIVSRFRDDVEEIGESLSWATDAIGLSTFAIVALVIMLQIDPWITLGTLLPLLVIILVARWAGGRIERYRQANRAATARVTGAIGEVFGGIEVVQLANAERAVLAHIDQLNDQRGRAALRDRLFTEVLNAISGNMTSLGMGIVLIIAASSMAQGRFTVGDFALFAAYLWPLIELMRTLGALAAIYIQTGVSFRRMSELAPENPADALVEHGPVYLRGPLPAIPPQPVTPADRLEHLDVIGLSYRHPSSGRGIADITFRIRRGTLTVIAGRVGAGKTTLLRALLGLLPADSGDILWNGLRVADPATWMTLKAMLRPYNPWET